MGPAKVRTGPDGHQRGQPARSIPSIGRWPELRYATRVGGPSWPPLQRLREGLTAYKELATHCFEDRGQPWETLEGVEAWYRKVDSGKGDFGCYLSGNHSRERSGLKLYLDLFSGGESRRGLANWVRLLRSCGAPLGELERMEALLPVARPVLGCFEKTAEGTVNWRLYWRLWAPSLDTLCAVGDVMSVSHDVCREVHEAFEYAAGGPSCHVPVTGFAHPVPLEPGAMVFYSAGPSRWAKTEKKKRRIREIWESWGGASTALMRVWQLVTGAREGESWAPTLTLLGLGVLGGCHRRASAYFRVMSSIDH